MTGHDRDYYDDRGYYPGDDATRAYPHQAGPGRDDSRPSINAGRLWAGGAATALVAALVAFVGLIVVRSIFGLPVLAPSSMGAVGDASTGWLVLVGVIGALLATALMHALLIVAPRPRLFFGWIVALVTVAFALYPFTTGAQLATKIATAAIYLLIGLAIAVLVSGAATGAAMAGRSRR